MAIQSQFYDGTSLESRTFPSSKHIATKQHMAVWVQQVADDVWVQTDIDSYQLINNSCVLNALLNTVTYKQLEVRVADTPDELTTAPSDISIVAGIATEVATVASIEAEVITVAGDSAVINTVAGDTIVINTVAGDTIAINVVANDTVALNLVADDLAKGIGNNQPTDSAILNALTNANQTIADVVLTHADVVITNGDVVLTNADVVLTHADVVLTNADVVSSAANATNAQLFEWEAEAERLTATSYALEAEDVPVNLVTSDGDGTFTYTPQAGVFSALHYSIKAGTFNPALYALLTGATFTGQVKGIPPIANEDLTRKDYVDTAVSGVSTDTKLAVDGKSIIKDGGGWIENQLSAKLNATLSTTPPTIDGGSYNFATITRAGTGIYDVTFTTTMDTADYTITHTCEFDNFADIIVYESKTVNGFRFRVYGMSDNIRNGIGVDIHISGGKA